MECFDYLPSHDTHFDLTNNSTVKKVMGKGDSCKIVTFHRCAISYFYLSILQLEAFLVVYCMW